MNEHSGHGDHGGESSDAARGYTPGEHALPGGLSVSANGLRFAPSDTRFEPGTPTEWTFQIRRDDGTIVTDFDPSHGERGHLVVVRRDLTRFQHRHPELGPDGTWREPAFALPAPGVYRAFVDVVVEGRPTTLGFDLFAPGSADVAPRPGSTRRAMADGYEVTLLTDDIPVRADTRLPFEIRRDGEVVGELEPYLDALGHLVALREGDLGYLHVHPETTAPGSGRVEFTARFPTPGRYRLFLQTKPEGHLITTRFDLTIGGEGPSPGEQSP